MKSPAQRGVRSGILASFPQSFSSSRRMTDNCRMVFVGDAHAHDLPPLRHRTRQTRTIVTPRAAKNRTVPRNHPSSSWLKGGGEPPATANGVRELGMLHPFSNHRDYWSKLMKSMRRYFPWRGRLYEQFSFDSLDHIYGIFWFSDRWQRKLVI